MSSLLSHYRVAAGDEHPPPPARTAIMRLRAATTAGNDQRMAHGRRVRAPQPSRRQMPRLRAVISARRQSIHVSGRPSSILLHVEDGNI
jgi:hypothetical protein